jgi:hypothetical protein
MKWRSPGPEMLSLAGLCRVKAFAHGRSGTPWPSGGIGRMRSTSPRRPPVGAPSAGSAVPRSSVILALLILAGHLLVGPGQAAPLAAQAGVLAATSTLESSIPPHRGSAGVAAVDDPLGQAIWTAAALQRILVERDYPAILTLALMNRPDAGGAGRLEALTGVLAAAPDRVQRCRGLEDPVEGTLCSLEALVPLLPASEGRGLADEGARLLSLYLRPAETLAPGIAGLPALGLSGGEGRRLGPLQDFAQGVLEETLRQHLAGSRVGDAYLVPDPGALGPASPLDGRALLSSAVASLVGFSPDAGAATILGQVPELQSLLRAHPGIASLESSAGGAVQATLLSGEAVLRDYQGFLTSVTGSARGLLDHRFTRLLAEGGGEAAASGAVDWATQRSFVYLASRTASLAGLEGGVTERIQALGNAAADLRQEGAAFRSNLTGLGQQLAMAALGGNVFTLASGVATFLQLTPGAVGPGAAQEIRALRGLVEDLQGEMAEGFADVQLQLTQVMGELDRGFGRMEVLVAANHREVREEFRALSEELAALGSQVDRLDANLVTYLQAGFDRDYTRTLIRCLEHRERHLPPFDQMEFGVFSECLADFRARGARDARDALLTDRTTPVDDRSLTQALADPSPDNLARRLPLLARVAEQRFGYAGMRGGRGGANPLEWTVASQAYLTMLRDWPELAARVSTGDLETLLATGVETREILHAIVEDPASGLPGGILDRVLADYVAGVADLTAEADLLARRHQQAQLRRVDPTSLLNRMTPEEVGRPTLPAPRRVAGNIPQEVRTAAVLALEEPVLVYRMIRTDSLSTENVGRRGIFFRKRHDRLTHTRIRMEVELRLDGGEVVAGFRTEGPMVLRRVEEMAGDPGSDRVRSTVDRITDPEGHFLETIFPELAAEVSAWHLTPPRATPLLRLESGIEAELRRNESASLNRIFGSVCRDGTLDAALDGEDLRSADRIRGTLDRMGTARLLLASYVRLAVPASSPAASASTVGAVQLEDLVHGRDGLLDRGALCSLVDAGESALRVVWLEEEPRARAALVADALARALGRALPAETEGNGAGRAAPSPGPVSQVSMLESTLQQIRAAIRLQRLRVDVAQLSRIPD